LLLGAVALFHVDGEERDADYTEDKEGRETACSAGLLAPHVVL
jgi:hypothetical protein